MFRTRNILIFAAIGCDTSKNSGDRTHMLAGMSPVERGRLRHFDRAAGASHRGRAENP
jgi:hypothetical protein